MHDIKFIRENPEAFDAGLARRGLEPQAAAILSLDAGVRTMQTNLEKMLAARNESSKVIGDFIQRGEHDAANAAKQLVQKTKELLPDVEANLRGVQAALKEILAALPNLPDADVPDGADEAGNVEVLTWGTKRQFNFAPREHADLGPALGLDFETGALISGARFTFLRGQMARLQRAIGQFMLDHQTAVNGYNECAPPLLVREESLFGTGQLPKFFEDNFQTTDGRWLIPTAEVSLTNAVRGKIFDVKALPIRMTALTPCFRSEAGAAGKDTRGYIRQHQFEKVELVSVCRSEDSPGEHERMVKAAESILEALDLPYRKMLLCVGDMGFTAQKTFDLEVWLPGQQAYREISSISNCGEFQARRMNARYRRGFYQPIRKDKDGRVLSPDETPVFVHTLNGSGLAVGRTLVAVLENYQREDGSVEVPAALLPYMGGIDRLVPG